MLFRRTFLESLGIVALTPYQRLFQRNRATLPLVIPNISCQIDWEQGIVHGMSITLPSGAINPKISSQKISVAERLRQFGILPTGSIALNFFPVQTKLTGQGNNTGNKLDIIKITSDGMTMVVYSLGFIYLINGEKIYGGSGIDDVHETKLSPLTDQLELKINAGMSGKIIGLSF